jgi:hypothetical protein
MSTVYVASRRTFVLISVIFSTVQEVGARARSACYSRVCTVAGAY